MSTTNIEKQKWWTRRIADYKSSGIASKLWCGQEACKFHTLRYWIKWLNQQQASSSPARNRTLKLTDTSPLVTKETQYIQVSYESFCFGIPDNYHEDTLIRLLGTLKKARSLSCNRRLLSNWFYRPSKSY